MEPMIARNFHPALDPGQFYIYQAQTSQHASLEHAPRNVEVPSPSWDMKTIQLVEVAPPPPRRRSPQSVIMTTSSGYTSSSWASSSSAVSSEAIGDVGDEEGSYCSSDEESDEEVEEDEEWCSEKGTTGRVLAWRDSFSQAGGRPDPAELKACGVGPVSRAASGPVGVHDRDMDPDYDDAVLDVDRSQVKRQASPSSSLLSQGPHLSACEGLARPPSLPFTCCSACDACFSSLQHYRRHGADDGVPEACRLAVSYGLECLDPSSVDGGH